MKEYISQTEENYLKAIFKISEKTGATANTNAIAQMLDTSAASVTDMLKRLAEKDLIHYEKYRGVTLTGEGHRVATLLIRKHRLWEVFLVEKLDFSWDEVHEVAEQLEHIRSPKLVERLDSYLSNPKFDPHGDPIPDADGKFAVRKQILLAEMSPGQTGKVVGVQDTAPVFLKYLDQLNLSLGSTIHILEKHPYDESMQVSIDNTHEHNLSKKVSQNLFIQHPGAE